MKQIGGVLPRSRSPLPASPRASATALRTIDAQPPRIFNPSTDADIPRSAWSAWIPQEGARELRRHLSAEERSALEARRDELAAFVAPFHPSETDAVAASVAELLGAYRSMRQTGDEAMATVESLMRALAPYPAWAIAKACSDIRTNGIWRDGKFDRRWAPNDAEIIEAVRKEASIYADQHRSAVALLEAKVEGEANAL